MLNTKANWVSRLSIVQIKKIKLYVISAKCELHQRIRRHFARADTSVSLNPLNPEQGCR